MKNNLNQEFLKTSSNFMSKHHTSTTGKKATMKIINEKRPKNPEDIAVSKTFTRLSGKKLSQ